MCTQPPQTRSPNNIASNPRSTSPTCPVGRRYRRDDTAVAASNPNHTSNRSSRISPQEVNFDELSYDPADKRRISDYIGDQLQNDVRRKYLTKGPCKPPPGFNFPQTIIAGAPRRCQHEWFNMPFFLRRLECFVHLKRIVPSLLCATRHRVINGESRMEAELGVNPSEQGRASIEHQVF
jgi:hypothetical protein